MPKFPVTERDFFFKFIAWLLACIIVTIYGFHFEYYGRGFTFPFNGFEVILFSLSVPATVVIFTGVVIQYTIVEEPPSKFQIKAYLLGGCIFMLVAGLFGMFRVVNYNYVAMHSAGIVGCMIASGVIMLVDCILTTCC